MVCNCARGFRHDRPQLIIGGLITQDLGLFTGDPKILVQFPQGGRAASQPVPHQPLFDTRR
jgi:hypothetical protein